MNTIEKITHWGDIHHPGWMDILRMGLGGIIFYKGLEFASNIEGLRATIESSGFILWTFLFAHYIILSHVMGGILIALGLITRWAIIFQIPILIGAVILNGKQSGLFDFYSQLWFSIIVLALLIAFLVYGSGPFSVDEHMRKHPGG